MPLQTHGVVLRNERVQSLYFLLEMDCSPIARIIKPGQFVMVKISQSQDLLLRRPFSLFKNTPGRQGPKKRWGRLSILYKTVGKGTQKMTKMEKGDRVDLIGPLGNGFTFSSPSTSQRTILIAGGVGIVPLYPLAEALKAGENLFVFMGGKTKNDILCVEDFKKLNSNTFVATEDGSLGYQGTVIDLFLSKREKLWKEAPSPIYSSGPLGMLKELAEALGPKKYLCQASLEARMGCGFGACWGCVVRTTDTRIPYQRVCKEGPVFNLGKIFWEER
jgi:dihydroorotate dehydrogenase electron transfer subunit